MANRPSSNCWCCFFFFFLHLVLFLANSVKGSDVPYVKDLHDFEKMELDREKEELFPSIHRTLIEYFHYKLTEFDSIDPPTTALPSAPITNPVTAPAVTTPPVNSAPGIVTVPGTNPVTNPTNTPVTNPVNTPVTNPVNTPVTNPTNTPVTNPVNTPVTNPVNTPVTNPVTTPSTNPTPSPPSGGGIMPPPSTASGGGGRWCIAKNGASQAAVQSGLDYACGIGGADCSMIQQGASCYNPATLENHASYAFNSYYQKNPVSTSCDFGGAAVVTTSNPSTGSCVFPSSSSSSSTSTTPSSSSTSTTPSSPITQAPVNPTSLPPPTTSSSSSSSGSAVPGMQSPSPGFNLGNPDPTGTGLGSFGASPPLMNTASVSNNLHPLIVIVIASIIITSRLM